ncbi:uncharacterized protein LOC129242518 [Anastrepha obliqua]|uniref:uncharacterized protein LOC129242518 n=1 Tax=Anastrepha obliqua TaxID=95512 RepID=UPI002409D2FD|nr:uncharacterized protein LOC129242518 [Anastrepha obliqua]
MCPLDNAERYFTRVRSKYRGIDGDLIKILAERKTPEDAICLGDLKDLYRINTEDTFPPSMCIPRARQFLLTIPNIATFRNADGVPYFYSLR